MLLSHTAAMMKLRFSHLFWMIHPTNVLIFVSIHHYFLSLLVSKMMIYPVIVVPVVDVSSSYTNGMKKYGFEHDMVLYERRRRLNNSIDTCTALVAVSMLMM
jgi:hypothetical protein